MPRKRVDASLIKVCELWWKYLKRSPNYIEFCEWIEKKKLNADLPIPKKGNWFQLWEGYGFFGNIHVDSFEEWWKRNKEYIKSMGEGGFPRPIEDYTDFVMSDMEDVINNFKRIKGREPCLQEFKRDFLEKLKFPVSRFYFMVSLFGGKRFEELGKLFMKILSEKRKEQTKIVKQKNEEYRRGLEVSFPVIPVEAEKFVTWAGRWRYPTTQGRRDELRRYLDVFDYFSRGQKWRQIADAIPAYRRQKYEDAKGKMQYPDSIRTAIYSDRNKAERIIENTEQGIFPGEY